MLVASRGGGKTWLLSLYALLRAIFCQGSKIVIVGAAFRQSKILFEYMETFWKDAPIVQHIIGHGKGQGPKRDVDRCTFYVGRSVIHCIPLGDGTKIRGLRASHTIADEFASIPLEIFENVVGGFSSVRLNPVSGVKEYAKMRMLADMQVPIEPLDEYRNEMGNQTVLSGTAYYSFNHFAEYWQKWKAIIESGGDERKLTEIFAGSIPERFDHKKYGVVRIPVHKLPPGFMDETHVARAKATVHSSIYQMEYGACFCTDSDGFYPRSLIESCVCDKLLSNPFKFSVNTRGEPNKLYVIGVDPSIGRAAGTGERDNFAIVVLEVHENHYRVVYCWTMNQLKHKERVKHGVVKERDFYAYCARKVRELAKVFPTQHIGIDAQGGGVGIIEAWQDPDKFCSDTEVAWLPHIARDGDVFWWEQKDKPTDKMVGAHIIHAVQFAKADWTHEANHNLRKDMEDKAVLFPFFDPWVVQEAIAADKARGIKASEYDMYDTLEDAVVEIEQLKDELATIQHSMTPSGRDKWDTPEVVEGGGKKGHLRKDRYSALVIAAELAHILLKSPPKPVYEPAGGYAGKDYSKVDRHGQMYIGPPNLTTRMSGTYGMGVKRR
jgi:hypothetical protein